MEKLRAFLAIDLGDALREAVSRLAERLRERPGGSDVRWVRSEGLHVTLRFLGDIHADRVGPLVQNAGREVAAVAPFAVRLGAPQAFPSARRPRVVALGVEPEAPLAELAAAVERGVVATGFAAESRPFRPHLTLGRLRGGRAPELGDLPAPRGENPVRDVVLYQSHLGPGGSRYVPLERMPLAREG